MLVAAPHLDDFSMNFAYYVYDGVPDYTAETRSIHDDGAGHVLRRDLPLPVCDKTARRLESLGRDDLLVTGPTWFYDGGGCC
jgi:hypothetical protein